MKIITNLLLALQIKKFRILSRVWSFKTFTKSRIDRHRQHNLLYQPLISQQLDYQIVESPTGRRTAIIHQAINYWGI